MAAFRIFDPYPRLLRYIILKCQDMDKVGPSQQGDGMIGKRQESIKSWHTHERSKDFHLSIYDAHQLPPFPDQPVHFQDFYPFLSAKDKKSSC